MLSFLLAAFCKLEQDVFFDVAALSGYDALTALVDLSAVQIWHGIAKPQFHLQQLD